MSKRLDVLNKLLAYVVKPMIRHAPFDHRFLNTAKMGVDIITHIGARFGATHKTVEISETLSAELTYKHHRHGKSVVLYLHGGGFLFGSSKTHRTITTALAKSTGLDVFALDYRLAPEHPAPSQIHDAIYGFNYLISRGYKNIFIAGDSAGGNLALVLTRVLMDGKSHLYGAKDCIKGCIAISPWVDLTDREEYHYNDWLDPMIPGTRIHDAGRLYAQGYPTSDPLISPRYMRFENFPRTMVTVGELECLLKPISETVDQMGKSGVEVEYKFYKNCPHVFQLFTGVIPEATGAIRDISKFIREGLER